MASPRQTARSRAILVPTLTRYRREDAAKLQIIFIQQKKKGKNQLLLQSHDMNCHKVKRRGTIIENTSKCIKTSVTDSWNFVRFVFV